MLENSLKRKRLNVYFFVRCLSEVPKKRCSKFTSYLKGDLTKKQSGGTRREIFRIRWFDCFHFAARIPFPQSYN